MGANCCGGKRLPIFRYLLIALLAVAFLPVLLLSNSAEAGAWIPETGHGDVKPVVRYSFADQSFPSTSFSTATAPGSSEHKTQIRVLGEHGLGDGFSVDYDLRYGFLYRSKVKKGVKIVETNDGFQDQRVGLNYALTQDSSFADAVGLSIVLPGSSTTKSPGLDSGQWAMEPVYKIGFKPGFWKLTTEFSVGSRVFLDGGVAQFRARMEVRAPVLHGLHLTGKFYFVRSARLGGYNDAIDHSELYNLFRMGIEASYHLTPSIEPVLAYEHDIAGMGRHASQRFTIGVKFVY